MSIVAVTGDVTTTTAVALAVGWSDDDVVLVEADPSGGDLAAWFDEPVTPSLSTVVTSVIDGAWSDVEPLVRVADNGLRFLPAPARAAEAARAVGESARSLVGSLAARSSPTAVVDVGRSPSRSTHPFVGAASLSLVVHRQATQSARAAAVRLQRLADELDVLTSAARPVVIAVVGDRPFGLDEIGPFLSDAVGAVDVVGLPDDPLTAAVFAGRAGVSARRLARLPLTRAARQLATVVERAMVPDADQVQESGR